MSLRPLLNIVAVAAITHGIRTVTLSTRFGSSSLGVEPKTSAAWLLTMSRIACTEVSWKPSVG